VTPATASVRGAPHSGTLFRARSLVDEPPQMRHQRSKASSVAKTRAYSYAPGRHKTRYRVPLPPVDHRAQLLFIVCAAKGEAVGANNRSHGIVLCEPCRQEFAFVAYAQDGAAGNSLQADDFGTRETCVCDQSIARRFRSSDVGTHHLEVAAHQIVKSNTHTVRCLHPGLREQTARAVCRLPVQQPDGAGRQGGNKRLLWTESGTRVRRSR
jgi:hypothetical protein